MKKGPVGGTGAGECERAAGPELTRRAEAGEGAAFAELLPRRAKPLRELAQIRSEHRPLNRSAEGLGRSPEAPETLLQRALPRLNEEYDRQRDGPL